MPKVGDVFHNIGTGVYIFWTLRRLERRKKPYLCMSPTKIPTQFLWLGNWINWNKFNNIPKIQESDFIISRDPSTKNHVYNYLHDRVNSTSVVG